MASKDARAHQAGYVQTNDAAGNEVVVFDRSADGQLTPSGRLATGGRGTGDAHLASQSSVVLSHDAAQRNCWLSTPAATSCRWSRSRAAATGSPIASAPPG
jgi:hypothetical protein